MARIGKSLNEGYRGGLVPERAVRLMEELLASQAEPLVQVRAQGPSMIACLVVRADPTTVRLCQSLGFEIARGGTGVFGVHGTDAVNLFPSFSEEQRTWLSAGCAPRETKVVLIAGGIALVSIDTTDGKARVRSGP
jgi:hypothetical protein